MRASAFEFRFRIAIIVILLTLGFWSPGVHASSVWILVASAMAHRGGISIQAASLAVGEFAAALALISALLRTWGAAYLGAGVVFSGDFHAERVVAAGPYRYLRNPLYLGSLTAAAALAIFMPAWGALFSVLAVGLFLLRLIGAEEAQLSNTPGYREYAAKVPRLLPALSPRIAPSGAKPHWLRAFAAESYCWGSFLTFLILAPQFNGVRILQGVLASLGASLVIRGFMLGPAIEKPL